MVEREGGGVKQGCSSFVCSFCGKRCEEVKKLIMGPAVAICDECVAQCAAIIGDEKKEEKPDGG